MKLGVIWPWASPFTWTRFTETMLNLERPAWAYNFVRQKENVETRFFRGIGFGPAKRHYDGCLKALQWGADLLCILGSDQVHPEDTLCRLVTRWNEGYEVVAALVPTRGHIPHIPMRPFQPVAYRIPPNTPGDLKIKQPEDIEQFVDIIDPADGDMQKIHFIGSGVLLFHREHLMALKHPWFYETIHHETQERLACMDTKFVWRLQTEAGARVWCDTTIKVKHLHDFEIDETFQWRFTDWATPGAGDAGICQPGEGTAPS